MAEQTKTRTKVLRARKLITVAEVTRDFWHQSALDPCEFLRQEFLARVPSGYQLAPGEEVRVEPDEFEFKDRRRKAFTVYVTGRLVRRGAVHGGH